jgi:hypothetical protein
MAEGDGWRVKRGDFTAEHAETAERKTEKRREEKRRQRKQRKKLIKSISPLAFGFCAEWSRFWLRESPR